MEQALIGGRHALPGAQAQRTKAAGVTCCSTCVLSGPCVCVDSAAATGQLLQLQASVCTPAWRQHPDNSVLARTLEPGNLVCRVSGTAAGSTAAAGQALQLRASFRDAFLNSVQDAAAVRALNASLAYSGPVSGSRELRAANATSTSSVPCRWCATLLTARLAATWVALSAMHQLCLLGAPHTPSLAGLHHGSCPSRCLRMIARCRQQWALCGQT